MRRSHSQAAFANTVRSRHYPPVNAQQLPMKGSFVSSLFYDEPAGAFAHGYVFINAPELSDDQCNSEIGYWHCDIAHQERLTWSDTVYELFGLPNRAKVDREWAVSRYSPDSKGILEKVRGFALRRKCGFILDAEISAEGADRRWIRVLAIPILVRERIVGLHGLKRAL